MRHYAVLLVAQFAMGSGAVFGRMALGNMTALSVAAWRLGLVAVPLLLRLAWQHLSQHEAVAKWTARPPGWRRHMEASMLLAGLLLAAQFVAWVEALRRLSMGMATLLVCTSPLWNSLYEVVVQRRRLPASFWAALLVGMGGVAAAVGYEDAQAGVLLPDQMGLGVALALGSSLLIALYLGAMRHVSLRASRGDTYSTLDIITRVFSWGALVLFLGCLGRAEMPPPLHDRATWTGVLGMALVTQGLGHSLQNSALRHLRASIVGFATLLEPLIAAFFGWLCFDEALGWPRACGGVLVVLALGHAMWLTAVLAEQTDQLEPG